MKKLLKPILIVLVFAIMQGLSGVVLVLLLDVKNPRTFPPVPLALSVIISGILSVLICWLILKAIRMKETLNASTIDWRMGAVGMLAAILGIISTDLLSEQLDLPNLLEDAMLAMSQNVWGILSIALVGPVVEELLFREGIIGTMLQKNIKPWVAIVCSALLFGLIHGNPAQIPFAAIMGVLLGMVYYKSGNIWLSSIIHVFNNSLAVVEMNVLGEKAKDVTYSQLVGGNLNACVIMVVAGVLCVLLMMKFWKNYRPVNQ